VKVSRESSTAETQSITTMPAWTRSPSWSMLKRIHFSAVCRSFGGAERQRVVSPSFKSMPRYSPVQYCNLGLNLRTGSTCNVHFRGMSTTSEEEERVGEDIYQQALSLTKEADDLDKAKEEERSNKMYEAYQKSKERELNPKSQGVTVVKTLVKQVRKERTKKDDSNDKREQAFELLKKAANEYNHPDAAVRLGNVLLKIASRSLKNKATKDDGPDPKDSVGEAIELFRRAGDAGSRIGYYNLGHLLWTGFPPQEEESEEGSGAMTDSRIVAADIEEAMTMFYRAIDLGDCDAMYLVGVHKLGEDDVESNRNGFKLIEQAAGEGHEGALYYLALLNLNGDPQIGLEACSLDEFVVLLDKAVDAGSVDAQFIRGNSFYGGTEGFPQDFRRALDDLLQAADEGHADSAVSAGAMFHNGVGVLKDQRKAFELYQLAGELGSKEGWMNVVDCWEQGLGVPKSEETARYIRETMLKKK